MSHGRITIRMPSVAPFPTRFPQALRQHGTRHLSPHPRTQKGRAGEVTLLAEKFLVPIRKELDCTVLHLAGAKVATDDVAKALLLKRFSASVVFLYPLDVAKPSSYDAFICSSL